jgi:hypothetical protein
MIQLVATAAVMLIGGVTYCCVKAREKTVDKAAQEVLKKPGNQNETAPLPSMKPVEAPTNVDQVFHKKVEPQSTLTEPVKAQPANIAGPVRTPEDLELLKENIATLQNDFNWVTEKIIIYTKAQTKAGLYHGNFQTDANEAANKAREEAENFEKTLNRYSEEHTWCSTQLKDQGSQESLQKIGDRIEQYRGELAREKARLPKK